MLGLKSFVQQNAIAVAAYPVSELDIFNRRFIVPPDVKASDFQENLSIDGTAAGPESRSFGVRSLVNEVMEEILVLGNKILSRWIVVIRAEHCRQSGIHLKLRSYSRQSIGPNNDVCVHEQHNVPARALN